MYHTVLAYPSIVRLIGVDRVLVLVHEIVSPATVATTAMKLVHGKTRTVIRKHIERGVQKTQIWLP